MSLRLACSVLVLAAVCNGLVKFSQSTMYDIYDFRNAKEVPLPNCDNGCLLFASTTGDASDAYERNLFVRGPDGKETSIAAIAKQRSPTTSQKMPYDGATKGSYSIVNKNGPDDKSSDVTVWVIDRTTARAIDYEIYDSLTMARKNVVPQTVITIMGATRFQAVADKGAPNTITARLVGFDNALDNNADECTYAYKTQTFVGFEFNIEGPIVSLAFGKKNLVAVYTRNLFPSLRDLSLAGFITSPGFHGCEKVDSSQIYHMQEFTVFGEEFDMHADIPQNVTWDVDANVASEVVLRDMTNSKRNSVNGTQKNMKVTMDNCDYAMVDYNREAPPYGFIARHSGVNA